MLRRTFISTVLAALWTISFPSISAVSSDEAAALKSTLTPLGAEKAGNKDGSIPPWEGGLSKSPAGYKAGSPRPDPYAAEKPLLQISAKNLDQYKDKLTDGVQALMRKYPSFRVDVYPTHRTASAPQWVYDNTYANATRSKSTQGGNNIENAFGGIPFPIPKTGAEVMWNHLLRWKGESVQIPFRVWVGAADGSRTMAVEAKDDHQFPYYEKGGSLQKFNGEFMLLRQVQTDPPFKAGESILLRDPVDQIGKGRQAWQYLTGQRRVRRAPTIAFDTPDFVASGQNYFDEVFMFLGSLERYDWKLVGKKEIFVPYNNNKFQLAKTDEVFVPHHLNPEKMRWELHRVWEIEANLAPGKRHVVPKKRFYVDEDSWSVLLVDGYDAQGKLWRTQHAVPFVAPDIPAVVSTTFTVFNLQAGTWLVNNLYTDMKSAYNVVDRRPESYFSADALAGAGVR